MTKPYVHSNYERIKDDDYQTIDLRCVTALVESYSIYDTDDIVDCCSPNGSGIIDGLVQLGYKARGIDDAFSNYTADWCVSNPPYTRGLVDKIIWQQIGNLEFDISGVAMLLRNNFDFAKSRYAMFTHDYYVGQIHMMFRPWWSEEKKAQPIHNYVWHIWKRVKSSRAAHPIVIYWKE